LHNQVKIPSPAPGSEVSGTDRSVTGSQTRPWIHSGVAFPVPLHLPLYWVCFELKQGTSLKLSGHLLSYYPPISYLRTALEYLNVSAILIRVTSHQMTL